MTEQEMKNYIQEAIDIAYHNHKINFDVVFVRKTSLIPEKFISDNDLTFIILSKDINKYFEASYENKVNGKFLNLLFLPDEDLFNDDYFSIEALLSISIGAMAYQNVDIVKKYYDILIEKVTPFMIFEYLYNYNSVLYEEINKEKKLIKNNEILIFAFLANHIFMINLLNKGSIELSYDEVFKAFDERKVVTSLLVSNKPILENVKKVSQKDLINNNFDTIKEEIKEMFEHEKKILEYNQPFCDKKEEKDSNLIC